MWRLSRWDGRAICDPRRGGRGAEKKGKQLLYCQQKSDGCNARSCTAPTSTLHRNQGDCNSSRYHQQQRTALFLAVSVSKRSPLCWKPVGTKCNGRARAHTCRVGPEFINKRSGQPASYARAQTRRGGVDKRISGGWTRSQNWIYVLALIWIVVKTCRCHRGRESPGGK